MGVGVPGAIHLLKLAQRRPLKGSVLTLGVQDTQLTREALLGFGKFYCVGVGSNGNWSADLNPKPYYKERNFITGASFWRFLGFSEIVTTDVDDFENADVIFDLNEGSPPPELCGRFDVVFDGGTLEHVYHFPNALKSLHKMVKPGGLIIHQAPSSNHPDHGFYMFSPTVFHDYYSANRYRSIDFKFFMYPKDSVNEPTWWMDYIPGSLQGIAHGGFGVPGMSFAIACAFEKTGESTCDKIPQQSWYLSQWNKG